MKNINTNIENTAVNTTANTPAKGKKKKGVLIAVVSLALVAVAASGIFFFNANHANRNKPVAVIATTTNLSPAAVKKASAITLNEAHLTAERLANGKVQIVNGETVYVDTKNPRPHTDKVAAFYYVDGKTSKGFDWDYRASNNNVLVRCDYNFDRHQYQFGFFGMKPGATNIKLTYFTEDNVKKTLEAFATVDKNLNLTIKYL